MNLNKALLIGRLVDNPELRTTTTGQQVCSLRIATNRVWTDKAGQKQESSEFHTVVLWQKLAEIASQYLKKGNLVYIEGRLQTRSWQDQQGQKRYRTEIVAERLQMGPKGFGEGGGGKASQEPSSGKTTEGEEEIPVIEENEEINVKDIPF